MVVQQDSHDKRNDRLRPYTWLKQTILKSIFLAMFSLLLGLVSAVVSKHYTNGRVIFNEIIQIQTWTQHRYKIKSKSVFYKIWHYYYYYYLMSPQHFFNIKSGDSRAHYPSFAELRSVSMATGVVVLCKVVRRLWRSAPVPSMADGNPTAEIHTFQNSSPLQCS